MNGKESKKRKLKYDNLKKSSNYQPFSRRFKVVLLLKKIGSTYGSIPIKFYYKQLRCFCQSIQATILENIPWDTGSLY